MFTNIVWKFSHKEKMFLLLLYLHLLLSVCRHLDNINQIEKLISYFYEYVTSRILLWRPNTIVSTLNRNDKVKNNANETDRARLNRIKRQQRDWQNGTIAIAFREYASALHKRKTNIV